MSFVLRVDLAHSRPLVHLVADEARKLLQSPALFALARKHLDLTGAKFAHLEAWLAVATTAFSPRKEGMIERCCDNFK